MKAGRQFIIRTATLSAFAALSLSSAQAQPFGMMGDAYGPGMMGQGTQRAQPGKPVDMVAVATARLDNLKAQLKITAQQETAWQAFSEKAKQQAGNMQAMRDKMQPPAAATPLPAPERLEKATEFMKQRLAGMETMSQAVKDLYAVLSAEQKTVLDQHFAHASMKNPRNKMKRPDRMNRNQAPATGTAETK
jgi:hypothetical protein